MDKGIGMESWMVNVVIAVVGVISTYAVLRSRVERLEQDLSKHVAHDDVRHSSESANHGVINREFTSRIDAVFKRLDIVSDRITILERDTANHLDMPKAEERFVSHKELQLHINNIENNIKHMDKNVEHMSGKLDELTSLLSTHIVKTLSGGDN